MNGAAVRTQNQDCMLLKILLDRALSTKHITQFIAFPAQTTGTCSRTIGNIFLPKQLTSFNLTKFRLKRAGKTLLLLFEVCALENYCII